MRCLIVDDSAHFRVVASAMLERAGIAVVGTASTMAEAIAVCGELHPDIALVDVDLGEDSGFDVAEEFQRLGCEPPMVILVSTHSEQDFADLIAASPAVGFVPKVALSAGAIQDVLAGAHPG
jgi:DNA-binding NarL/FixJ family response regulator